jgi:hypothetical protein
MHGTSFAVFALRFSIFAAILVQSGCRKAEHYTSREINGVTARFDIITPRIHIGQVFKITATYKNETEAAVVFRHLPPLFDAQIWRGAVEELPCTTPEMPYTEVTLKPGQEYVVDDELPLDQYCHEAGPHEIRFCYNLQLLPDKQLAEEYRNKYSVTRGAIAWEDHGHAFTIQK